MLRLSCILVALLLQPVAYAADRCAEQSAGSQTITVRSGGKERAVELYFPGASSAASSTGSSNAGRRVPLIIGLHGSGGSGVALDQATGLRAAATAKGFAVLLPNGGIHDPKDTSGNGYFWNIPGVPLVSGGDTPPDAADDVRFIADVIDHVVKRHCVDKRRIFVTGFSGGGRMTSLLGCRLADRITAIAPVAGLRAGRASAPDFIEPDTDDCRPKRPISVLSFHGTDDPTNPFPGGSGVRWGYPVELAASRWASLDRCDVMPAAEHISEHVTRLRYGECRDRSEVVLYKIDAARDQGGGHVWPGGAGIPAEVDATKIILEFFAAH
jgi:polyhydroxybutyrate depolymerase